ncbi:MAG: hypothetical protein P1U54_01255 [Immundisolibacteraceae bacterium]|nr:hypothetical protein [Immundisolibacteraceae bacterium]
MWISSPVCSDSHILKPESFQLFQRDDSNIRIHEVRKHDFVLSVRPLHENAPESAQIHDCHRVISSMLVALNTGVIGTFRFSQDPWAHLVLNVREELKGSSSRTTALIVDPDTEYSERKDITEHNVKNCALIFGIIARESTSVLTGEYLRGLLLMRMNVLELNFRRESFLCFYRALEHFAANRILKVTKLSNELRDLQRALRKLTDDDELIGELQNVYRIRSSQVAHSQNDQEDISLDDLLKTKVFLDFVIHKTFKKEANEAILKRAE